MILFHKELGRRQKYEGKLAKSAYLASLTPQQRKIRAYTILAVIAIVIVMLAVATS
jgi:hypothetical protein